jgi:hypothetical protein
MRRIALFDGETAPVWHSLTSRSASVWRVSCGIKLGQQLVTCGDGHRRTGMTYCPGRSASAGLPAWIANYQPNSAGMTRSKRPSDKYNRTADIQTSRPRRRTTYCQADGGGWVILDRWVRTGCGPMAGLR